MQPAQARQHRLDVGRIVDLQALLAPVEAPGGERQDGRRGSAPAARRAAPGRRPRRRNRRPRACPSTSSAARCAWRRASRRAPGRRAPRAAGRAGSIRLGWLRGIRAEGGDRAVGETDPDLRPRASAPGPSRRSDRRARAAGERRRQQLGGAVGERRRHRLEMHARRCRAGRGAARAPRARPAGAGRGCPGSGASARRRAGAHPLERLAERAVLGGGES